MTRIVEKRKRKKRTTLSLDALSPTSRTYAHSYKSDEHRCFSFVKFQHRSTYFRLEDKPPWIRVRKDRITKLRNAFLRQAIVNNDYDRAGIARAKAATTTAIPEICPGVFPPAITGHHRPSEQQAQERLRHRRVSVGPGLFLDRLLCLLVGRKRPWGFFECCGVGRPWQIERYRSGLRNEHKRQELEIKEDRDHHDRVSPVAAINSHLVSRMPNKVVATA